MPTPIERATQDAQRRAMAVDLRQDLGELESGGVRVFKTIEAAAELHTEQRVEASQVSAAVLSAQRWVEQCPVFPSAEEVQSRLDQEVPKHLHTVVWRALLRLFK